MTTQIPSFICQLCGGDYAAPAPFRLVNGFNGIPSGSHVCSTCGRHNADCAPQFNTDERVSVVMKANIEHPEFRRLLIGQANEMTKGKRDALDEAIADLFAVTLVTRPSGSRYAVVDFA